MDKKIDKKFYGKSKSDDYGIKKMGGSEFLIRIMFRQNASWQGEVQWVDEGKKTHFRSLLELIMLLHEGTDRMNNPGESYHFKSWDDKTLQEENQTGPDKL